MAELTIDQALTAAARLAHAGKHPEAIGMYRAVLVHEPDNVEATIRLGSSLFESAQHYEAFFRFWRARDLAPRDALAAMNFGLTLSQLKLPEVGVKEVERAVRLLEKNRASSDVLAMAYNNLGNTLERLGRHADAYEALKKGISFDPFDDFPHYNLGIVLLRLNRQREAIAALYHSLALKRQKGDGTVSRLNEADTYYNLSMAHLLLGELKDGFRYYDARMATTDSQLLPYFGLPIDQMWKPGEPIKGKRLLLHGEQGLGDAIQMMRFLSWIKGLGPKEIVLVEHSAIKPLLAHEPVTILNTGDSLVDRYDVWTGIMSLPRQYGVEREDQIPKPYWFPVMTDRVNQWKDNVPALSQQRLKVGVCWAGNFQHKNDAHRSIKLVEFAKLFKVDAPVHFISVQQLRDEDRLPATELAEGSALTLLDLKDFRDTAAVMMSLDLMVTVDTSVAHLAGTLGIPTWVLIPKFGTDWRWQLERTDSPWYPSMTLYRQPRVGDWRSVLDRVGRDLVARSRRLEAA